MSEIQDLIFVESGPLGLSSDAFLNMSTELLGVLISVPLSILVAVLLDSRAERRLRRQRTRSLLGNLVIARERLFVSLTSELAENLSKEPWRIRLTLKRTIDQIAPRVEATLVDLISEHSSTSTPKLISALEQEADVWYRLGALLRFSSAYLTNARNQNAPNNEIIAYHQAWLRQCVDRLEKLGDHFREIQLYHQRNREKIDAFERLLRLVIERALDAPAEQGD